jgi:LmbE family N-acetylglucosaminyl deacetylase
MRPNPSLVTTARRTATPLTGGGSRTKASKPPLRILTAYAHPDDESFGPAALLAAYARRGAIVHGLFATRGECGRTGPGPKPPPEHLAALRERDLRQAAAVIGFAGVELLDYRDGTLERVPPAELEARILDALRRHRAEVILTFGPGGITGHPDHIAVHRAATAAFHRARAEQLGVRELYYQATADRAELAPGLETQPDARPNTWIDVGETRRVQPEALRLHGRHVVDARERAAELRDSPPSVAALYRAWPPVPPGATVTAFLEHADGPRERGGGQAGPLHQSSETRVRTRPAPHRVAGG